MEGIVIFTALVAMTSAQVVFPDAEKSIGGSSNSDDVDSQFDSALSPSDRNQPSQSTNKDSCSLPDGSIGICIRFRQCSAYNDIVLRPFNTTVVDFLRARVCRLLQNSIHLCCPAGNEAVITPPQDLSGSQNTLFPSNCGQSFAERIILGTEIKVGAYPWLVAIGRPTPGVFIVFCGGSLITRRHVLTASHCFPDSKKVIPTHARVGEHDVTSDNDGANPQTVKIKHNLTPSLGYNKHTKQNDITLVVLERDVSFNSHIQPICLPFRPDLRDKNFVGDYLDVVGWGRTNYSIRKTSPLPLEAKVEVVTLDHCQEAYRVLQTSVDITKRQLCAGTGEGDSCAGDSGGPLNYLDQQTGRFFLAGVTSFGKECGRSDFPGVYVRVGSYLDWIETNVN